MFELRKFKFLYEKYTLLFLSNITKHLFDPLRRILWLIEKLRFFLMIKELHIVLYTGECMI